MPDSYMVTTSLNLERYACACELSFSPDSGVCNLSGRLPPIGITVALRCQTARRVERSRRERSLEQRGVGEEKLILQGMNRPCSCTTRSSNVLGPITRKPRAVKSNIIYFSTCGRCESFPVCSFARIKEPKQSIETLRVRGRPTSIYSKTWC